MKFQRIGANSGNYFIKYIQIQNIHHIFDHTAVSNI